VVLRSETPFGADGGKSETVVVRQETGEDEACDLQRQVRPARPVAAGRLAEAETHGG